MQNACARDALGDNMDAHARGDLLVSLKRVVDCSCATLHLGKDSHGPECNEGLERTNEGESKTKLTEKA